MTKILVEKAIIHQALKVLEVWSDAYASLKGQEVITALREALSKPDIEKMTLTQIAARHEQAEQVSVAWMNTNGAVNKLREAGWAMNADPVQQAEQEPVAIMSPNKANIVGINAPHANIGTNGWIPLYAAPVRTKDLTDDEIAMCMGKDLWNVYKNEVDFARAVIAADREKNKCQH